jgi:glycine hydroxymethyltransferase
MTESAATHSAHHWQALAEFDAEVAAAISGEERRERDGIELIPSENYTHPEVHAALGSVLTNKYAEGYPGRRYYGGQKYTNRIENLARDRAKALFGCEHANVQPHSGSPMNQAVYYAFMEPGDTIIGMDLSHGGHLTHGSPVSHMGRVFRFERYKTDPAAKGAIDFDALRALALECRPKILLCGHTSYPRDLDYAAFKRIADEVGAISMADISHIGGLVAAGVVPSPVEAGFDVVTTTTHKSLRGPRGGMILCRAEFADRIDRSVFPGLQGGPHMHTIAAIAVALKKAAEPAFRVYGQQVLDTAQALARTLLEGGADLVSGGTDNHLIVMNTVASHGLDGRAAERLLDSVGITTNKQIVPDDPNPPLKPSGIRLGTPAAAARGMHEAEMRQIGSWILAALATPDDSAALAAIREDVRALCRRFPVPGFEAASSASAPC